MCLLSANDLFKDALTVSFCKGRISVQLVVAKLMHNSDVFVLELKKSAIWRTMICGFRDEILNQDDLNTKYQCYLLGGVICCCRFIVCYVRRRKAVRKVR
jgi:hypothetical protein